MPRPRPRRIFHIPSLPRRRFSNNFFRFNQTAHGRYICCRPLITPDGCDLPVIFQTLAYVSPHDCFLTSRGDGPFMGSDSDPDSCTGSCWLEPCNNEISRDQWCRMQQNIMVLRETTEQRLGVPVHLPFMYRPSHSAPYIFSMQVGTSLDATAEVSMHPSHLSLCILISFLFSTRLKLVFQYLIVKVTTMCQRASTKYGLVNRSWYILPSISVNSITSYILHLHLSGWNIVLDSYLFYSASF